MEKRDLIYEGKAKKVYATDDPANLIVCYKDDATAFDGMKKGIICGKGAGLKKEDMTWIIRQCSNSATDYSY